MKIETYIISNWQKEIKQTKHQQQVNKQYKFNKLMEFKESVCDMFTMADFYYYAEEIGCNVSYLLNMAIYSNDVRYIKYIKPARDLQFRRWFYINNGHSITKPNPLLN